MSTNTEEETSGPKIFYGWFIVAACFALTFTFGETAWSFGVFIKPLEKEFEWSRSLVSSGSTALLLGHAVSVLITGRLIDRYSPRWILIIGALTTTVGYLLSSQIQDTNQLRFSLFIAGLGTGPNWSIPNTSAQRWFYRRKGAGLALAIVTTGIGVGALVFAPLLNHLVLLYGWRNAFLFIAVSYIIIVGASSILIKRSPVETGDTPEIAANGLGETIKYNTRKMLSNRTFIGIVLINCITIISFQAVSIHLVPYATDTGVSPAVAAAALGLMGGISAPPRVIAGLISSRVGWQKILTFSPVGMALSMLLLVFLQSTWMLYSFVFLYGIFLGSMIPAQLGILGVFFGMRSLGETIGIVAAASVLTGAFAPYLAGFVFDATGSYFGVFLCLIFLLLVGGLIASIATKPKVTERRI